MELNDLFWNHKPYPKLKAHSANTALNEYLVDDFLKLLIDHMTSIAGFMPNPEYHNLFIEAIKQHLSEVFMRVVDWEETDVLRKEKEALEKKLEKLRKELDK